KAAVQGPNPATHGVMQFGDPLMFVAIMKLFKLPNMIEWNPVYWAAWGALLVTALNLFPVGQLDGGHVVYAIFGPRLHRWISGLTCAGLTVLTAVSFALYHSPIWLLWTLILFFLLKVGHPPTYINDPLGRTRVALAVIAAVVFLLCFLPFPITIS
ncbi:MAG TPA: site-2 protease family protein, partial [Blastocatellia bacterium]|nr:site-2 protease family protein [Blastocatellia bacterium]